MTDCTLHQRRQRRSQERGREGRGAVRRGEGEGRGAVRRGSESRGAVRRGEGQGRSQERGRGGQGRSQERGREGQGRRQDRDSGVKGDGARFARRDWSSN